MDKPLLPDNINPTVRLVLRPGVEVAITGLPVDLTSGEAFKITQVIAAFCTEEPAN